MKYLSTLGKKMTESIDKNDMNTILFISVSLRCKQRCLPFQPECKCLKSGNCAECPKGCRGRRTEVRDSLRLLAEIHFINAEVCCSATFPF